MLGPPKLRLLDQPVLVSLEALVPQDHFYRHLDATLDLSFVRAWVQDCYAERGRPSIDPVVFFKLQLIMFFEGLRSESKLIETASLHLAHRWYLGYHLDEPLPDHSSLTRIRERLGLPLFERFFAHIVELCQQAGLVWGAELFFDGTKVRANAGYDSLVPRWYVAAKAHVESLFAEDAALSAAPDTGLAEPAVLAAPSDTGATEPPARLPFTVPVETEHQPEAANDAAWRLLDEHRLDPARPPSGPYRRITDFRVSTTDPDATPLGKGHEGKLGYHDHYVVDGGRARSILAALVTPAEVAYFMTRSGRGDELKYRSTLSDVFRLTTGGTRTTLVAGSMEDALAFRSPSPGSPARLTEERAGKRVRTFRYAGVKRSAMSVGGSEHLGLPEAFPQLEQVEVFLGWFGRWTRPIQFASTLATPVSRLMDTKAMMEKLSQRLPGASREPDSDGRSLIIAVARDGAGRPLATTALTGPDPYTMTASLLAWGTTRAADPEAGLTPGAHGPVVAFGLDALALGAAEAGIQQAAE